MKSVVILSGGMDSTVALHATYKETKDIAAISIHYGQRHSRELDMAAAQCKLLGIPHKIVDLSSLRDVLTGSSQTDASVAVPHGHYAEENMKKTVVPNRNMILLAVAAAYGISLKADDIVYGAHAGDHAIYPDCREEFASAVNTALLLADWHQIRLSRPFIAITKADIVRLGTMLGVDFKLTHTCYEGEETACGKCGTCVERLEAFSLAGVEDPLDYRDRTFWKTAAQK